MRWSFPLSFKDVSAITSPASVFLAIAFAFEAPVLLTTIVVSSILIITILVWAYYRQTHTIAKLRTEHNTLEDRLEKTKVQIIYNRNAKKTAEYINDVNRIYLTHFQDGIPADEYIEGMLEKLENGEIEVTRIIPKDLDMTIPPHDWLNRFEKCLKDKSCPYTLVETEILLPFDISVFDDKKVVVMYSGFTPEGGSRHFTEALLFEHRRVVQVFLELIRWLTQQGVETPKG